MECYHLKNEFLSVTVSQRGGELLSVCDRQSGREYLWRADPAVWGEHAPLLFPFCGRLKNAEYSYRGSIYPMGLHGFLRGTLLPPPVCEEKSLTFTLCESAETLRIYPFPFRLTLVYRLEGRKLSLLAAVENTGEAELPFAFGGHPGIAVKSAGGDLLEGTLLRFSSGTGAVEIYPLVNSSFVPSEGVPFPMTEDTLPITNELFRTYDTVILKNAPPSATLTQPDGLSVTIERGETLPYFCLWKSTAEGADYVCLEPWSGTPQDGVTDEMLETHRGLCRLAPAETREFSFSLTFTDGGSSL